MGYYKNDNDIYTVLGCGIRKTEKNEYVNLSLQLDNKEKGEAINRSGIYTTTLTFRKEMVDEKLRSSNISYNDLKDKKYIIVWHSSKAEYNGQQYSFMVLDYIGKAL